MSASRARAESLDATAAPQSSVMKSRRFLRQTRFIFRLTKEGYRIIAAMPDKRGQSVIHSGPAAAPFAQETEGV